MKKERVVIENIPAIIWGEPSDKVYLYIHGKMSDKESAHEMASIAIKKGFQVISFDLPEHGERKNEKYVCDVKNGIHDLEVIYNYVSKRWNLINLYANSLGAYFSLVSYQNIVFEKCLFSAPLLDMEHLILNMMKWFDVSEERLKQEKYIKTPIGEVLIWDYYQDVKAHPIIRWESPTYILWGTKDTISEKCVVDDFISKYNVCLTVIENGEHYIQDETHKRIKEKWMNDYI